MPNMSDPSKAQLTGHVGKKMVTSGFLRETENVFEDLTLVPINSHENEPVGTPNRAQDATTLSLDFMAESLRKKPSFKNHAERIKGQRSRTLH